ncbi:MAG: hypothetical protein HY673_11960 [Chloroflexi bacterium]|nr:hypothetical protein [Chloroflexota bacterium]
MSKVLRLALVLLLTSVIVMSGTGLPVPALAQATDESNRTTISPQIGIVGDTVALAGTWGAAAAGSAVTVYLSTTTGQRNWTSPSASGDVVASASADTTGAWGTNFIVPDRKRGLHEVFVLGGDRFAIFSAQTPVGAFRTQFPLVNTQKIALSVDSKLTRSPSSGGAGTTITVRGTGFPGDQIGIQVRFISAAGTIPDKIAGDGITATSRGSFSISFKAPDGPAGAFRIRAYIAAGAPIPYLANDSVIDANRAFTSVATGAALSETFTMLGSLTLSPSIGPPGATVSFSGSGLTPNAMAMVKFDGVVMETTPSVQVVSATGIVNGSFRLPSENITNGPKIVTIEIGGVALVSANFEVSTGSAALTIDPPAGGPGIRVNVTGLNFSAASPITIKFDNEVRVTTPATIITTTGGAFTGSIIIPWRDNGFYTITATDGLGKSASGLFRLNNGAAKLTLFPSSGVGSVTLTGRDFTEGSPVSIYFGGQWVPSIPQTPTSSTGVGTGFSALITIPTLVPGDYEVLAIDASGLTGKATFAVPVLSGVAGPPGPVVAVVDKGARLPVTVLDASSNPVAGATVNLVNAATGATAASGATGAAGLAALTAPNVTAQTWFRVEVGSGSPSPRRVLVLDSSLASLPAALSVPAKPVAAAGK